MQPADSFLPRKRARTTAFCDAAVQTDPIALAELFYFVRAGRRYVRPYNYDFETHAKGRWVGRTLLQVFSEEFSYQPQDYFPRAIAAGRLTAFRPRENRLIKSHERLQQGDRIRHVVHRHEPSVLEPAVHILAESSGRSGPRTQDVLAVCKSASLPVHACGRYRRNTVESILKHIHGYENLRLVHRLDKVTSGVMLFAKTAEAARHLTSQIQSPGSVRKEYLARVVGTFPGGSSGSLTAGSCSRSFKDLACSERLPTAIIQCGAPLIVDPKTRRVYVSGIAAAGNNDSCGDGKRKSAPNSKPAVTEFQLLSTEDVGDGSVSLVHCVPKTGRTHQIRAHLAHLGHPIVDDPLYNPKCAGVGQGVGSVAALAECRHCNSATLPVPAITEAYAATTDASATLTVDVAADTGLDSVCAHCPMNEPMIYGAGDRGEVDSICLHALAYSSSDWIYTCPESLLPPWATSLLPASCLLELERSRVASFCSHGEDQGATAEQEAAVAAAAAVVMGNGEK